MQRMHCDKKDGFTFNPVFVTQLTSMFKSNFFQCHIFIMKSVQNLIWSLPKNVAIVLC